ncbi:hypothetical protein [Neisseria viridiae]|uniref:hypothetical protein n=1 Tax=Neisseria viridiae TaxID=2830648 RepID=UPI0026585398|nr:hypothetical protein [Neisseria viridiae]
MFPQKILIRHSRAGGNPDLNLSEIFRDSRHFKFPDSRLRGNDAVKEAVLIKRLLFIKRLRLVLGFSDGFFSTNAV